MASRYGLDGYGRYVDVDGERYMVEFYPFPIRSPLRAWYALSQAVGVFRWHVGMIRQHGWWVWNVERKL